MILEGIVTTIGTDGVENIAPMGPIVEGEFQRLVLRPFPTSQTYANLKERQRGILHVTDDVELIVQAALDRWYQRPTLERRDDLGGCILLGACRWYAFVVEDWDESGERPRLRCTVVERGWLRDFWGFNRAKHAVLEAAILATRIGLLPRDEIERELARLRNIVGKTAGPAEQRAMQHLDDFFRTPNAP